MLFSCLGVKLFYIFSIADSYLDFNVNNSQSFLSILSFLYKFLSFLLSKVLQQLTRCHGALIVEYFPDMSCEMIVSQLVSSADMHHHWQAKSNLTYVVNYSYNTQSEVIEEKPWLYIYIFLKESIDILPLQLTKIRLDVTLNRSISMMGFSSHCNFVALSMRS